MTAHLEFTSAGERLVGTFQAPDTCPAPAALLISGSGPLDRDSNTKRLRVDVMRQVAEHLATIGVASFRYDKRGIGASTGDYHSTGFSDNTSDARHALEALKARPEVDPGRIVAIGHSEGALIAAELAAGDGGLAGAVLLAGSAHTGEQVLRWQAHQVSGSLPAPIRFMLKLFRRDVPKMQDKRLTQLKQSTSDVVRMQLVKVNAKWFREFLEYEPAETLRRIRIPILAITGAKDIQVDPDDISRMETLVVGDFTGRVIANMSHLLRTTPEEPPSLRTYRKQAKQPVDSAVLDAIASWVPQAREEGAAHDSL